MTQARTVNPRHVRIRDLARELGRLPSLVLFAAALVTAVMYCTNDNVDPHPLGNYRPQIARGDGHLHFLLTRSLVFNGDFNIDDDLKRFGDPWNQPLTATGRRNAMQQIGPSLIWAPLLFAARGCAAIANLFGAEIAAHGYTMFHQRIVFASGPLFAWLSVALAITVTRRLTLARWPSTYAATAVLLGTTLTYYATLMPAYAHVMDAAICSIFLARWVMTIGDLRWRRAVELGAWLGVAAMVRIQDFGFGVVLVFELVPISVRARSPRVLLRGALVLAIALVMFVPQLYEWKQLYDSYFTTPQGPGQMRYSHPEWLELLFSPRNGWLSTHPIAYLGTMGLAVGVLRGRRLPFRGNARLVFGALLAVVVLQVYVNAITYEWWSGASFGQRRMASSTLPLIVGLAALLDPVLWMRWFTGRVRHIVTIVGLGYLIAWNVFACLALKGGAPAGHDNGPTCCAKVPVLLSWLARPIYGTVGNPFEWPASAYFAIHYRVPLTWWDETNGQYPLVPGVLGYLDGSYRQETGSWPWATPTGGVWLLGGFGPSQHDHDRAFRWTTANVAEGILPTLMPEPHRVAIPIAGNVAAGHTIPVTVKCNGHDVVRTVVDASWTMVVFDTDGTLGDNIIAIEATPATYRDGPTRPVDDMLVGVAVGSLHVSLPPIRDLK